MPVARPTAAQLARGLLAYATFPQELRDWARVVVCVADLGEASRTPEGPGCSPQSGATEGRLPDDETLVVLEGSPDRTFPRPHSSTDDATGPIATLRPWQSLQKRKRPPPSSTVRPEALEPPPPSHPRGHLHPPRSPLRARGRDHGPPRIPLRRPRPARVRGGGDPRLRRDRCHRHRPRGVAVHDAEGGRPAPTSSRPTPDARFRAPRDPWHGGLLDERRRDLRASQRDVRPERYLQNQTLEEQHDLYRSAISCRTAGSTFRGARICSSSTSGSSTTRARPCSCRSPT